LAELETRKAESETKVAEEKKEAKKLTIGQKIKKEVQHYWDGTKLLATEVKISSALALKMAAGYELSRRENRQVSFSLRQDISYLIPTVLISMNYSFNELFKIWAVWFLSLSSLSSLSRNSFSLSP
jgi:hypothetical protein